MTKHWTFEDSDLANHFGDHVKSQLPWYDIATGLVRCIVENYLPDGGVLYDVGASLGNITNACADLIQSRNARAISIEPSKEMCAKWNGYGEMHNKKAEEYAFQGYDVCVMFLTLMFVMPSERNALIENLMAHKREGGALVIVDKFEPPHGYIGTVCRRMTLRQKLAAGESCQDIIDKELSLSGVQRPIERAPDGAVQFFQVGEFKGYVI